MTPRTLTLAAILAAACASAPAQAPLPEFYPVADSVSAHPPFRSELETLCQVKVRDRWVSFVGYRNTRTVLYTTFTLDSLADPVADVSPIVGFEDARPTLGKVSTWGYPFDRNRDGKIDYLALVGGAAPVQDAEFPPNFPRHDERLMAHHVEMLVAKCRIVFTHWADDNYDGGVDGAVIADMDPERTWVYRRILARSRSFDGPFDDVWPFRTDTSGFRDTLTHTPAAVHYRALGVGPAVFGRADLEGKTAVMALMNEAIEACGRGSFRLPSGKVDDPVLE